MKQKASAEPVHNSSGRRAAMIDALNKALEVFCSYDEKTFNDVMSNGLNPIARAMDVNRITFFRYINMDGEMRLKQMYRWDMEAGGITDKSLIALPDNRAIKKWFDILIKDDYVNQPLCDMSGEEIEFMNIFGIKSVLMMPIFTHGSFWGCVIFQDHDNERYFEKDCMDLFRSAARLCANNVILAEMERLVAEKNELNQVMFNTMPVGLIMCDDTLQFTDCNETLLSMFGNVTKQYFISHFFEFSPEYQPDGSKSREKVLEVMKQAVNGEEKSLEWMHCLPTGEMIPCEITVSRTKYGEKYVGLGYVYDLRNVKKMEKALTEAEELAHTVMEASPISYIMFDNDLIPIDCNITALQVFGCPNKQYLLDHYWDRLSPEYQPDGRKSIEKAQTMKNNAVNEGKTAFEWIHKTYNGKSLPMENTLSQIMYNGEKHIISYKYDLRNIKEMEANIRWLESEAEKVYYDALTGIYNRRYFDENLQRLIKTLSRSHGILSLIMIDIDFFKKYNDTYGHSEGDNCLKTVAETLLNTVTRTEDFVARYGGEEFAVVLPNTDESGACMIAEKLLDNVRNRKLPHKKNNAAPYVTISIGVTTGEVGRAQNGDYYIRRADEMLYVSKQSGRNRYTYAPL